MKNEVAVTHAFMIVRESVKTYHLHQLSKFLLLSFNNSQTTKMKPRKRLIIIMIYCYHRKHHFLSNLRSLYLFKYTK